MSYIRVPAITARLMRSVVGICEMFRNVMHSCNLRVLYMLVCNNQNIHDSKLFFLSIFYTLHVLSCGAVW